MIPCVKIRVLMMGEGSLRVERARAVLVRRKPPAHLANGEHREIWHPVSTTKSSRDMTRCTDTAPRPSIRLTGSRHLVRSALMEDRPYRRYRQKDLSPANWAFGRAYRTSDPALAHYYSMHITRDGSQPRNTDPDRRRRSAHLPGVTVLLPDWRTLGFSSRGDKN
jgi:hypothetical protein